MACASAQIRAGGGRIIREALWGGELRRPGPVMPGAARGAITLYIRGLPKSRREGDPDRACERVETVALSERIGAQVFAEQKSRVGGGHRRLFPVKGGKKRRKKKQTRSKNT